MRQDARYRDLLSLVDPVEKRRASLAGQQASHVGGGEAAMDLRPAAAIASFQIDCNEAWKDDVGDTLKVHHDGIKESLNEDPTLSMDYWDWNENDEVFGSSFDFWNLNGV